MNFYQSLQMDPSVLKKKIAQCNTAREKTFYWSAIAIRSVLIVAFAVLFISLLSGLFGQENTPFAVALFCIMLGIRFVNFEYCIRDSMITLAISLCILVFVPSLVGIAPPIAIVFIHFAGFFALLFMTTQRPELGNGGLYSFAYVYLTGNPVYGDSLRKRILLAVVGYAVCGLILWAKHRHSHKTVRFRYLVLKFNIKNPINLWQLRMALGVSLVLTVGQILEIPRFMWMGFACASLLSEYPYSSKTLPRFRQRIIGALAGSGLFFIIYQITPGSFHSLMGPLGGLCLGFCTDYRYKTAMNCFGALMLATNIYGVQGAVFLRIADTILGVCFGAIFAAIFHKVISMKSSKEKIV